MERSLASYSAAASARRIGRLTQHVRQVQMVAGGVRPKRHFLFTHSRVTAMALAIDKVEVWSGEILDHAGGLAEKLQPLADAGADLSFLIARRQPDKPGTGIVYLSGLKGSKQTKAALAAGLNKAGDLGCLRIDAPNKPGIAAQLVAKAAAAGINLRGASASAVGSKCVLLLSFDSVADRDSAAKVLKK